MVLNIILGGGTPTLLVAPAITRKFLYLPFPRTKHFYSSLLLGVVPKLRVLQRFFSMFHIHVNTLNCCFV